MPAGLHEAGVHLLLWGGALLLAWALLMDWIRQRMPSRRRRRCPKCWYDLSHTPGLRCSECGCEAKRERRLFKAKRRWWLATFAVFVLLGSYALRVTPAVQTRGWVAAVPTPALIIALPQLEDPLAPTNAGYIMLGQLPQPRQLAIRQQLYTELITQRAIADGLPRWQKRWLAARATHTTQWNGSSNPGRGIYHNYHYAPRDDRDTSGRALAAILVGDRDVITDEEIRAWRFDRAWHRIIPNLIDMRDTWLESEPLRLRVSTTSYIPRNRGLLMTVASCDEPDHVIYPHVPLSAFTGLAALYPGEDDTVSLGRITADSDSICLLVSIVRRDRESWYRDMHQPPTDMFKDPANPADVVYSRRVILPIRVVSDPHEIVQPVTCPAFEEQLRSQILLSSVFRNRGQTHLGAFRGQLLKVCETEPITLAVIFEIRRENDIIYHGEAVFSLSSGLNVLHGASAYIPLDGDSFAIDQHADDDAPWTVHLRGDAALALRDPNATHYWQGEVIIPLEEVLARSHRDWWTNNPLEP